MKSPESSPLPKSDGLERRFGQSYFSRHSEYIVAPAAVGAVSTMLVSDVLDGRSVLLGGLYGAGALGAARAQRQYRDWRYAKREATKDEKLAETQQQLRADLGEPVDLVFTSDRYTEDAALRWYGLDTERCPLDAGARLQKLCDWADGQQVGYIALSPRHVPRVDGDPEYERIRYENASFLANYGRISGVARIDDELTDDMVDVLSIDEARRVAEELKDHDDLVLTQLLQSTGDARAIELYDELKADTGSVEALQNRLRQNIVDYLESQTMTVRDTQYDQMTEERRNVRSRPHYFIRGGTAFMTAEQRDGTKSKDTGGSVPYPLLVLAGGTDAKDVDALIRMIAEQSAERGGAQPKANIAAYLYLLETFSPEAATVNAGGSRSLETTLSRLDNDSEYTTIERHRIARISCGLVATAYLSFGILNGVYNLPHIPGVSHIQAFNATVASGVEHTLRDAGIDVSPLVDWRLAIERGYDPDNVTTGTVGTSTYATGVGDVIRTPEKTLYTITPLSGQSPQGYWQQADMRMMDITSLLSPTFDRRGILLENQVDNDLGALQKLPNATATIEALHPDFQVDVPFKEVGFGRDQGVPVLRGYEIVGAQLYDKANSRYFPNVVIEKSIDGADHDSLHYKNLDELNLPGDLTFKYFLKRRQIPLRDRARGSEAVDDLGKWDNQPHPFDTDTVARDLREALHVSPNATDREVIAAIRDKHYSYTPLEDSGVSQRDIPVSADSTQAVGDFGKILAGLPSENCNTAALVALLATDGMDKYTTVTGYHNNGDTKLTNHEAHAWLEDKSRHVIDATPGVSSENKDKPDGAALAFIIAGIAAYGGYRGFKASRAWRDAWRMKRGHSELADTYQWIEQTLYGRPGTPITYEPMNHAELRHKMASNLPKGGISPEMLGLKALRNPLKYRNVKRLQSFDTVVRSE